MIGIGAEGEEGGARGGVSPEIYRNCKKLNALHVKVNKKKEKKSPTDSSLSLLPP
jgi:hypothetical protein